MHLDLFNQNAFALKLILVLWGIVIVAGFAEKVISSEVLLLLVNMLHTSRLLPDNILAFLLLRGSFALQLQHLFQVAVLGLGWQSEWFDRSEILILKHGALSFPVVLEKDVRVGGDVFVAAFC